MKAKVHVTLKPGVLDPQGRAVLHALEALGFGGVDGVRQGKFIELDLKESDPKKAEVEVEDTLDGLAAHLERHLDLDALLAAAVKTKPLSATG